MKYFKMLFLLLTIISCRGQEKKNMLKEAKTDSAIQSYEAQKDRFEIKGYKLFYNDHLLKSDTLQNVFKILGKPKCDSWNDFVYNDKAITLTHGGRVAKDKDGHSLMISNKDGKTYSLDEKSMAIYNSNEGVKMIPLLDEQGKELDIIRKYRIHFQQYVPRYIADKRDSILMQIPPLDGFIKVNGFFINKNTTMEELKQKLKPTIKNADFFVLGGNTVSTWYYGTENNEPLDKFDPRINTKYNGYIRIDYVYIEDKLNAIDYYYDILE